MQYNGNIEAICDFNKRIKKYPKTGAHLLGAVVGGPVQYSPDYDDYFDKLMNSNDEFQRMNEFFSAHGLPGMNSFYKKKDKQIRKEREEIAAKTHSLKITEQLWSMNEQKISFEDGKEELVKLINESTFNKFGFLLANHLNYEEFSAITLKGTDGQLYNIFATDPRFKVNFEHVLRYYKYYEEEECQPVIKERIIRFNYLDYTAFMNGQEVLKEVDPDLQHVPFFQIGNGKEIFKFVHEGGSRTGGVFFPEQTQSISFHCAMIVTKVQQATDCEIKQ